MRTIGSYQLKTHLAEVLNAVARGQTVVVTRHGKPIAQITPSAQEKLQRTKAAVEGLRNFPRKPLPRGMTIRSLIDAGRR